MANREPDWFQFGINYRVPNLNYAADVMMEGPYKLSFGQPAAKSASWFLSTGALSSGVAATFTLNTTVAITNNGVEPMRYGRGLSIVASGPSTRTFQVDGFDYLGQPMRWTGALNGATPVPSTKAFKRVISVALGAAADTVSVTLGQSDVLGLSYRGVGMLLAILNEGAPTGAGTFVAGLADGTAPSATNGDVRGTWTPNAADIPDGTRKLELLYEPDRLDLHGQAQFGG